MWTLSFAKYTVHNIYLFGADSEQLIEFRILSLVS